MFEYQVKTLVFILIYMYYYYYFNSPPTCLLQVPVVRELLSKEQSKQTGSWAMYRRAGLALVSCPLLLTETSMVCSGREPTDVKSHRTSSKDTNVAGTDVFMLLVELMPVSVTCWTVDCSCYFVKSDFFCGCPINALFTHTLLLCKIKSSIIIESLCTIPKYSIA